MADHGDGEFDHFYLRTYGRVVAELYAVVGSVQEAEDIVQEAFARASVRWRRLRDYDHPDAWVRRVALNLATSSLRRAARKVAAYRRVGPPPPVPPPTEERVLLHQALGRLRHHQREVLVLHYMADLPVEEIARVLRLPTGTIKGRLFRARAALERVLGGEEPVSGGYEVHHA